jgi:hypothetical protein
MEELEWNPQLGMEYEIAIHAIARKISHGDFPYGTFTPREQEFALRYFPKTASLLNARNWKISIPAEFDPELVKLFAGIAALLPRENNLLLQASTPVEPGHDQTQLAKNCEDIRELKENADQLHGLWKDLKIFAHLFAEKAAPAEPQKVPTSFQQTLARYRKLMTDAKEKLKRFRAYPKITCV